MEVPPEWRAAEEARKAGLEEKQVKLAKREELENKRIMSGYIPDPPRYEKFTKATPEGLAKFKKNFRTSKRFDGPKYADGTVKHGGNNGSGPAVCGERDPIVKVERARREYRIRTVIQVKGKKPSHNINPERSLRKLHAAQYNKAYKQLRLEAYTAQVKSLIDMELANEFSKLSKSNAA